MEKLVVHKEELKINENVNVKLVSYEGDEAPYRILSGKNEFVVLNSNNFGSLHGRTNENGNLVITYMDTSLELTILKDGVLIENSRDE